MQVGEAIDLEHVLRVDVEPQVIGTLLYNTGV